MKDKQQVILEAIEYMKNSPFKATAIKVELEENLDRNWDKAECLQSILKYVSEEIGQDIADRDEYESESYNPFPGVAYTQFYDDGSVDSELTFTVRLDNPENIKLLPIFIRAWNSMAEDAGSERDVSGAGMHMAFLNSQDCSYPYRFTNSQLRMYQNFKKSMGLLLPAMFFLGTHTSESRALEYRTPRIGCTSDAHGGSKFNAINYSRGAVEFRVFDTCYDNPEAVLDNFVVMRNCMKYWRPTYLPSGMEKITRQVGFGNDNSNDLKRFYTETTHVDLLNHGLMRLKPSYLSVKDLKRERGFTITKSKFHNREKELLKEAERDYEEYLERFQWELEASRHYRIYSALSSPHGSLAEELATAEAEATEYIERKRRDEIPKESYLRDRLDTIRRRFGTNYTLTA